MSRTAVIVALATALVLVAASLLLGPPRGPVAAPGPVLGFSPARVIELRLRRANGPEERVVRAADGSGWTLAGGGTDGWPVVPARVRGMLRILADLTGKPVAGSSTPGGTTVVLALDDGSTRELTIEGRPIGGAVIVAVNGTAGAPAARYSVNPEIYEALVTSGPRAWRDDAALPGLGPQTARLTLQSGKNRLALARVQGRWGMTEPLVARAEPDAVVRLVGALAGIRIADFLDDRVPDAAATGLDRPIAVITAEADSRRIVGGEATSETSRRTLSIGGPADIGGSSVYALLEDGQRRAIIAIRADAFAGIPVQPADYIARTAVGPSAPDVADVVIRGLDGTIKRRFARTLDGWTEPGADGDAVPTTPADADAIVGLLALITTTKAEGVALAAPAGFEPVGSVSINTDAGGPSELVDFGVVRAADASAGARVVTHCGPVWRVYAAGTGTGTLDWLAIASGGG